MAGRTGIAQPGPPPPLDLPSAPAASFPPAAAPLAARHPRRRSLTAARPPETRPPANARPPPPSLPSERGFSDYLPTTVPKFLENFFA